MSDPYLAPAYVDPFDEGVSFAQQRPDLITPGLLAQPHELIADDMGYSVRDWRQFRKGALSVLMKRGMTHHECNATE